MSDFLFAGVGSHTHVDHVAIQVVRGKMRLAQVLFEKLGYKVDPTRMIINQWGEIVFMAKEGSVSIQLIETDNTISVIAGENHLAVMVDDVYEVFASIGEWMWINEVSFKAPGYEIGTGGKILLHLNGILTMPIELVPALFKPCPECGGIGEVIRGREGQGFHYTCPTCGGKKTVPAN